MPKHDWEDVSGMRPQWWLKTVRRCKLCRKVQIREAQTHWGRVIGYRWYPKVGRCPGRPERRRQAR